MVVAAMQAAAKSLSDRGSTGGSSNGPPLTPAIYEQNVGSRFFLLSFFGSQLYPAGEKRREKIVL